MVESSSSIDSKGIKQAGARLFAGILLALTLKGTLDVFFKNASSFHVGEWLKQPSHNPLFFMQLLVFIFTVIRFYGGTLRYDEEAPEEDTRHFLLGVIGALVVFAGFYVAGLLVRTTILFYVSLGIVHLLDLFWFLVAGVSKATKPAMQKICRIYLYLDIVTVLVFAIFISCDLRFGSAHFVYQWMMIASLLILGLFDLWWLRDFYSKESDWEGRFCNAQS
jgi:hypothetical protein